MRTSRLRRGGVVTILATAMLLLTHLSPASAVVSGSGGGTGWEFPQWETIEDCPGGGMFGPGTVSGSPADIFELDHTGTVAATGSGSSNAVYSGPTDVDFQVGTHVISPLGVGPDCDSLLDPVPVTSATLSGTATIGSGHVDDCTFTSGTYQRAQSAVTFHLEFTGCEVKGNVTPNTSTVTSQDITLDITGTMTPCDFPTPGQCVNPPTGAGSSLTTAYVAS